MPLYFQLNQDLNMEDHDHFLPAEEQESNLRKKLAQESVRLINEKYGSLLKSNTSLQQLKKRFENDMVHPGIDEDPVEQEYRRIYLELLEHQRKIVHAYNKEAGSDGEVIRKQHGLIDLEEEKLRLRFERE